MVGPSSLKALLSLQAFSLKSPSSSTLSSVKIKNLIQTFIYAQVCRLTRAFSKAKSIAIQIYKENKPLRYFNSNNSKNASKNYKHRKLFFGSFRLHYNWCSSHVTPVPASVLEGCAATHHLYYDSTWNSVISTGKCDDNHQDTMESELSGYLQWLEENNVNGNSTSDQTDINEIDRLAELFIAKCHEKFRLEKQESERRFQEMMARSI